MDGFIAQLSQMFPELSASISVGSIIFARVLGFLRFSPVFNRKEIPGMIKVCIAVLMTVMFTTMLKPDLNTNVEDSLMLLILLNFAVGMMIGWMAQLILLAVDAGGDMINMQMGLSSAMVMDPTSNSQVSIISKLIALLGLLIFINVGGIYFILQALLRSFTVFPVFATSIPLDKLVSLPYVIKMTSNVLYMGLQIASPVLLATLGQDIILGVISKTAPQVNVFQLSFLFKPVVGVAIMIWILPMLINIINDYFLSFSQVF